MPATHCPAVIPNFAMMEYWVGTNPLREIAKDCPMPNGVLCPVPTGPGLGITVDEDTVRRLRR